MKRKSIRLLAAAWTLSAGIAFGAAAGAGGCVLSVEAAEDVSTEESAEEAAEGAAGDAGAASADSGSSAGTESSDQSTDKTKDTTKDTSKDTTKDNTTKDTTKDTTKKDTTKDNTKKTLKLGDTITDEDQGCTYKVTSVKKKTLTLVKVPKKLSEVLSVPELITLKDRNNAMYKVTAVAKNAAKSCTKLQVVYIGKNVQSIGANAFKGCKKLEYVYIFKKKIDIKKVSLSAFTTIKSNAVFNVAPAKVKAFQKLFQKKKATKKFTVYEVDKENKKYLG